MQLQRRLKFLLGCVGRVAHEPTMAMRARWIVSRAGSTLRRRRLLGGLPLLWLLLLGLFRLRLGLLRLRLRRRFVRRLTWRRRLSALLLIILIRLHRAQ